MRRFEFAEGTSRKFWQIEVAGESLTVCFGRLGTQGQSKTKHFDEAAAAAQEAQSLIREKLNKGYVEVSADAAPAATPKSEVGAARPVARAAQPAVKAPPPAIKVTLVDSGGDPLIIRLQDKLVIIDDGSKRSAQTLDSYAAAKEHFERIVMLRKKSGATVLRTEEGAEENIPPPDIVDSPEIIEADFARAVVVSAVWQSLKAAAGKSLDGANDGGGGTQPHRGHRSAGKPRGDGQSGAESKSRIRGESMVRGLAKNLFLDSRTVR